LRIKESFYFVNPFYLSVKTGTIGQVLSKGKECFIPIDSERSRFRPATGTTRDPGLLAIYRYRFRPEPEGIGNMARSTGVRPRYIS